MKKHGNILLLSVWLITAFAGQAEKTPSVAPTIQHNQTAGPVLGTDQITIPAIISYQGKLTDDGGNPVPDSTYSITFRLFPLPTGGSAYWSETQNVAVRDGLFTCLLGTVTPIPYIPADGNCYLEMQVNPYEPFSPRVRLVSSAYAFLARKADSAGYAERALPYGPAGGDLTGDYPEPSIADGAVTSVKIEDGTIVRADVASDFKAPYADTADYARVAVGEVCDSAQVAANAHRLQGKDTTDLDLRYVNEGQENSITSAMIANAAVSSAKIVDEAVISAKIANGAVTSVKIVDEAVNSAKIADNAVSSAKIANGAVTTVKIADGAVTSVKIADNAVTSTNIADNAVTSAKIADNAVTSGKIEDNAVNSTKIADNAVTSAKIVDGAVISVKIADSAVTSVKIADNAVTSTNIADNAVTSAKIADNAVTSGKIEDNAVTSVKIADNAVTSAKIVDGAVISVKIADSAVTSVKIADNAVTSGKIEDNAVTSVKIADNAVTPEKIIDEAVTSAKIANGAVTSVKIVDEAVTSAKIEDGAVTSAKIADNAVTSGKIEDNAVNSTKIADNAVTSAKIADGAVTSAEVEDGTIVRADVASDFKAPYADTADYARAAPPPDSAVVAANAHRLQGKDTTDLDLRYVNEGQVNSITSEMIQNGAVTSTKIVNGAVTSVKIVDEAVTSAKIEDGAVASGKIADGAVTSTKIADNAVTSAKIGDGEVTMSKLNQSGATDGQVIKWNGTQWAPAGDQVGTGDSAWVRGTPDSVLYTIRQLGIARGGSDNMVYGNNRYTHTNLGVACTTGTSGQDYAYATVGGGYGNTAGGDAATVPGGYGNVARGDHSFAAGRFARANHSGSFVWSDSVTEAADSVYTAGDNQWRVRARGGVWFYSNRAKTAGVYLASGSNAWQSLGTFDNETDFRPVDQKEILKKLAAMRVRYYRMKSQNDGTRHIGPAAQDFFTAFGVGEGNKGINMADADGVLFAAIQALYQELQSLSKENQELRKELEQLKRKLQSGGIR